MISLLLLTVAQSQVPNSANDAKPLKVGLELPKVDLVTLDGKTVSLQHVVGGKKTVIVFYRGGWCPFCNKHLSELGGIAEEVKSRGAQMLAISPDTPEELRKSLEKNKIEYGLYSDSSAKAMMAFGVAFRVDDETFTMYRDRFKLDLEKASGQTHHYLPVPSVFVIDGGKVKFAYSNPDYKIRLKASEVLAALD